MLAQYANTIPLSNYSLLVESLKTVVAKAASTARDNTAMAEGFMQAGLHCPRPFQSKESHKRAFEGSLYFQEMPAHLELV